MIDKIKSSVTSNKISRGVTFTVLILIFFLSTFSLGYIIGNEVGEIFASGGDEITVSEEEFRELKDEQEALRDDLEQVQKENENLRKANEELRETNKMLVDTVNEMSGRLSRIERGLIKAGLLDEEFEDDLADDLDIDDEYADDFEPVGELVLESDIGNIVVNENGLDIVEDFGSVFEPEQIETLGLDLGQEFVLDIGSVTGEEIVQELGEEHGSVFVSVFLNELGSDVVLEFVSELGRDSRLDFVRDNGSDFGQDLQYDIMRDFGLELVEDAGLDINRDLGQELNSEFGLDLTSDYGQELVQDLGNELGIDFGSDIESEFGYALNNDIGYSLSESDIEVLTSYLEQGRDNGPAVNPHIAVSILFRESSFRDYVSNGNAHGLGQVKLTTAQYMNDIWEIDGDVTVNSLLDRETNLKYVGLYLNYLEDKYNGCIDSVITHYAGASSPDVIDWYLSDIDEYLEDNVGVGLYDI